MPQFELDVPPDAPRHVRGRSAEDAARRALGLAADAEVALGEAAQGSGWAELRVDGEVRGRLRARDRMRFRRD